VVLGVGVWTLLDKAYITNLLGSNLFLGAVYILIATGGIVALIAFLGCLGAVKEVKCMLVTVSTPTLIPTNSTSARLFVTAEPMLQYFMIIFIVFVTMLVGGILGYVFREDVRKNLDKGMRNSLDQYNTNPTITEAWDETQTVVSPQYSSSMIPTSSGKIGHSIPLLKFRAIQTGYRVRNHPLP